MADVQHEEDAPAFTQGSSDLDAVESGRKGGAAAGDGTSDSDNSVADDVSASPEEDNTTAYDTPHTPRSDVAS